jgi:hypothetical protein
MKHIEEIKVTLKQPKEEVQLLSTKVCLIGSTKIGRTKIGRTEIGRR